ncbi:deiodinase-like protein [Fontivita pretiosa]|uniref:deiodinase-like protein n=1 Tax=Fontivita pretiosa TaxID=2989684 RepID=UPI003D1712BC
MRSVNRGRFGQTILIAITILWGAAMSIGTASAAEEPKRPPATARAGGGPARSALRPGAVLERLRELLDELQLSDQQKADIEAILQEARQKWRAMAQELRDADPQLRFERGRQFVQELIGRIKSKLSDAQAEKLERHLQELRERIAAREAGRGPGAATQPGLAGPGPRITAALERLRQVVDQLELSDQQKQQIRQLFADTRRKIAEIREQARQDLQEAREQLQAVMQQLREQLSQILTEEQRARLRELLRTGPDQEQRPPRELREQRRQDQPPRDRAPERRRGDRNRPGPTTGSAQADSAEEAAPSALAPPDPREPDLGRVAPDFTLSKLDGSIVQLSSLYRERPVLLVFGSFSSPTFRQRAPGLEQIRREFSGRLNLLLVYTREHHPVGQWEVDRNTEEGIAVEQPAEPEARAALARRARAALRLSVPIVIDTMDDAVSGLYSAREGCPAFLIARDGTLVARQRWFEPYAMKRIIQDALAAGPQQPAPATSIPSAQPG